jgi:hypothetical protein
MAKFVESIVEDVALAWLESAGRSARNILEITLGESKVKQFFGRSV